MDLKVGDILNGVFRIEEILHGGMGLVYVCTMLSSQADLPPEERSTGGKVVWKSFPSAAVWDGATRKRFEREAQVWISLPKHPNVVHAMTLNRGGRQYLLCLEYVGGGNLRQRLLRGPLTLEEVLRFACQFCDGMKFIHGYGRIVHRDIKPENVLLTEDGTLKITDLGLARVVGAPAAGTEYGAAADDLLVTQAGALVGTLPYMAPEQFGDPEQVSERADQFAFGVVLYEMLAGRRPFQGRSIAELRDAIVSNPHPPLSSARGIPEDLAGLVDRCLQKRPSDRYPSFAEIREACERMAEGMGLEASIPPRVSIAEVEAAMTEMDWTGRGYALARLEKHEESLASYERAHRLARDRVHTNTNMAVALRRLKRPAEALPYDEQAVALLDQDESTSGGHQFGAFALLSLAATQNHLGHGADALATLQNAAQRYPANVNVLEQLVRVAVQEREGGVRDLALGQLEELLAEQRTFGDVPSLCVSAIEFAQEGFAAEAEHLFAAALERSPDSGVCWYNLGVLRHLSGEFDEALRCYTGALESGHTKALVLVNRGLVYAHRREFEAALRDWSLARRLDPGHLGVRLVENLAKLGEQGLIMGSQLSATLRFDM